MIKNSEGKNLIRHELQTNKLSMKNRSGIKESFIPQTIDYSKLSDRTCIIIDGDDHTGKSPLARELGKELGFKVISLDEELRQPGAAYWDQFDYESLRDKIFASRPKVIIEGVCALKVLAKINEPHDYHIFIKRLNGFLGWENEFYIAANAKPPKSKLTREIVQYYREYRPFDVCDLVLSRDACHLVETN